MTEPPLALTCTATETDPACYGGSNGLGIVACTGGTGAYTGTGDQSTNFPGSDFTGLYAGAFSTTVTDANNCPATATTSVSQPTPLVCTAVILQNLSCPTSRNGQANVSCTGATPPYDGTGYFSGLPAGTNNRIVFDNNLCSLTLKWPEIFTAKQPCLFSGVCSVTPPETGTTYQCACTPGNTGSRCETKIPVIP